MRRVRDALLAYDGRGHTIISFAYTRPRSVIWVATDDGQLFEIIVNQREWTEVSRAE